MTDPESKPRKETEARDLIDALAAGEVDAVIANQHVHIVRLLEVEQALKESEARYRAIVEDAVELICRWKPDFTITFANKAFCACFGGTPESWIGKRLTELSDGASRAALDAHIAGIEPTGETAEVEFAMRVGETWRWFYWVSRAIPGTNEDDWEGQTLCRDRTAFRQTEFQLDIQEALLSHAERQAGLGSWKRDTDTNRISMSRQLCRMLRLDKLQYDFPIDVALERIHPEDRRIFKKLLLDGDMKAIKDNDSIRVQQADGTYRWMRAQVDAIRNKAGEATHLVGTLLDIHEARASAAAMYETKTVLEERVAQRTKELQERAAQLTWLATQLTLTEQRERHHLAELLHDDLQQLLVSAIFHLKLTRRQVNSPEQLEAAFDQLRDMLEEATRKTRNLSHELTPPTLHAHGLISAIQWLADQMQKRHGLTVATELDSDADPRDESTRILVYKSIQEMLFNIVKHAKTEEATIRIVRTRNSEIRVTVADRGSGFDPEKIKREAGRRGFGLFSIQERVQLLGGTFTIESAPGAGSELEIILPGPKAILTPSTLDVIKTALPTDTVTLKRMPLQTSRRASGIIKVMLVDDHKVVREGIAALLKEHEGLHIAGEASSGDEGVKLADELRPDLILMDISMPPGIDGVEATRRIKQRHPDVIIIGLSMHEEPSLYRSMLEAGATAMLSKADASDNLISTIRKHF